MTVQINISGLEPVAASIDNLAHAISGRGIVTTITDGTMDKRSAPPEVPSALPAASMASATPAAGMAPATPAAMTPATPPAAAPIQAPQAAVPTSNRTYTPDDLAKAAMALMDSGHQGDLLALLQGFGVNSIPELPQAQYGAFATALRGMGAQI